MEYGLFCLHVSVFHSAFARDFGATCSRHISIITYQKSLPQADTGVKSFADITAVMYLKMRKRKGIGTVITTLIILIASVVLGAGVIFFGGSLFQTNTNNESIQISNAHIWVSPLNGTTSVAAFVVQNTGGKVVSVHSLTVRGMSVPVDSWYYNTAEATATNVLRDLRSDFNLNAVDVTGDGTEESFTHATGPVTISQGKAVIIYVANPGSITPMDSGLAFNINVQAGKASASLASVGVTNG